MYELTIDKIRRMTLRNFPDREIKTLTENGLFEYTYQEHDRRVNQLGNVLENLGVEKGDHLGAMDINTHRFFELYFGIPMCGAIMHTINQRFGPNELSLCINEANDKVLFTNPLFIPQLEKVEDELNVENFVVLSEETPETTLENVLNYEDLMEEASTDFDFPELSETDNAALNYTTGTTGRPKGIHYTHRTTVLQAALLGHADIYSISVEDTIMPITPMFHNYSWGFPYAGAFCGSEQIFPSTGGAPEWAELIEKEDVTLTNSVPTIARDLIDYGIKNNKDLSSLRLILCGGAPPDPDLIRRWWEEYEVRVLNAMGEAETHSATGIAGYLKPKLQNIPDEEKIKYWSKQGIALPGTEIKVLNEEGEEVEWNDEEMGELVKKGFVPFEGYYNLPEETEEALDEEGWFYTGDVVTVDEDGYLTLQDRKDDMVKSGGEWIATVPLENAIMEHPSISEAVVFRVPHEKWDERPLAVATKSEKVEKEDIIEHLEENYEFPDFWFPDDVIFVEEIPKTSVGKFDKQELMEEYQDYLL